MNYTGKTAWISKCGKYRYHLSRSWSGLDLFAPRSMIFIMLNPSTADADEDDPTIKRCVGFARSYGCERLDVINLFAYRATEPTELIAMSKARYDAIGPQNDLAILTVIDTFRTSSLVVCGWGEAGFMCGRSDSVKAALKRRGVPLHALRVNDSGQAGHPLYIPGNALLVPYE